MLRYKAPWLVAISGTFLIGVLCALLLLPLSFWVDGAESFSAIDGLTKKLADGDPAEGWFQSYLQPKARANPDAYASMGRQVWFQAAGIGPVALSSLAAWTFYLGLRVCFRRDARFLPWTRGAWTVAFLVTGTVIDWTLVVPLVSLVQWAWPLAVFFAVPFFNFYFSTALFSPVAYKYSPPGAWYFHRWVIDRLLGRQAPLPAARIP